MKAIDVLPILKEKVAFLSGKIYKITAHITDIVTILYLFFFFKLIFNDKES